MLIEEIRIAVSLYRADPAGWSGYQAAGRRIGSEADRLNNIEPQRSGTHPNGLSDRPIETAVRPPIRGRSQIFLARLRGFKVGCSFEKFQYITNYWRRTKTVNSNNPQSTPNKTFPCTALPRTKENILRRLQHRRLFKRRRNSLYDSTLLDHNPRHRRSLESRLCSPLWSNRNP